MIGRTQDEAHAVGFRDGYHAGFKAGAKAQQSKAKKAIDALMFERAYAKLPPATDAECAMLMRALPLPEPPRIE